MAAQTLIDTAELPLLRTKLFVPPPRQELVPRPRLVERLNAGLDRKLTLISAPAGFGKTTLVSEWARDLANGSPPVKVGWLSLDESDSDPTRFLTYVLAVLQRVEPDIGQVALTALRSPQPLPVEAVLTSLINDLVAVPTPIVLVLDDYHLIDVHAVHDAMTFLLHHLPQQLHLVVATRVDPLVPLAQLRARGQLTELRAADLRFTSAEAADFLNRAMGLGLSAVDVSALERRTEGWIAGLQLAAVSMQRRPDTDDFLKSFTGSHRFVLDYLVEEVLEQQSEEIQAFLLQTSILERLNGSLCDAVCAGEGNTPALSEGPALAGQGQGQSVLEMLQRTNLFVVQLDDERQWYRYHHLFADLLRRRLRQSQPDLIPRLHARASAWYEAQGDIIDAIDHAMRAEDHERALSLVSAQADALWRGGEHTRLGRWLSELPLALVITKPQLCIFSAWYLFAGGQQERAEGALQAAERVLGPETASEAMADRTLRGRLAAIRALMGTWWGDGPKITAYAGQALERLPAQDPLYGPAAIALGDGYYLQGDMAGAYGAQLEAAEVCRASGDLLFYLIAKLKLAFTLKAQGRLRRVLEICEVETQFAEKHGLTHTSMAGCLWSIWGATLAELGDMEGAIPLVERGVELTAGRGDLALRGFSYLYLMEVLFCAGDTDGFATALQTLQDLAREHDLPPIVTSPMAAWQGIRWLSEGKMVEAAQWAADGGLAVEDEAPLLRKAEYAVFARILLAQGRLADATELLARLYEALQAEGRTSEAIEILNLQALTAQASGDQRQALAILEHALALAEPRGFFRTFVNEGPPMAHLLYDAHSRGIAPAYAQRLLSAFPAVKQALSVVHTVQPQESTLIEALSSREVEVLQLIAQGLTNREVATKLFLSPHTIKTHTRNIYGKLDVSNRTQAVARARALGLLSNT